MDIVEKCDVLNLEWSSKGRDIHIVEPILNYLELKDLVVKRGNIFKYKELIFKYKPKVVILSNGVGDKVNYELIKFSKTRNIKVITLISEGDFPNNKNRANEFMWGWNKEKELIEDLHLQWSTKNLKIIQKYCNAELEKVKVVGATGFDRYAFMRHADKMQYLEIINKSKYKKIIGYAGWGFDIEDPNGIYQNKTKNKIEKRFSDIELENIIKSREIVNKMLITLIEANPDIFFILKMHPGSIQEELTEFVGVEEYPNVQLLRGNEVEILTAIGVSDIWLAFESTSCLEAWLMNKVTGIIKPIENDFNRSIISEGSPEFKSQVELQKYIEDFYNGNFGTFNKLEEIRKNIIKQIIEYSDGLNHVRAGVEIIKLINSNKIKEKKYKFFYFKKMMIYYADKISRFRIIKWIPIIKKYHNYMSKLDALYNPQERDILKNSYMESQKQYYLKVESLMSEIENA